MFIGMTRRAITLMLLLIFFLSGCTDLFFQPMRQHIRSPKDISLIYENLYVEVEQDIKLHGWFLPAQQSKGTVIFLHGNGENISTHISSVHWLPAEGFNVFLFDYRGYGKSSGSVSLNASIEDTQKVIYFIRRREDVRDKKLFLFGQSLGGAIAINALSVGNFQGIINALIVDSSFSDFRRIAREKLSLSWLLWPFQYPLSWTIAGNYDPEEVIANISPIPILIIHGTADKIIPFHHSMRLFLAAKYPTEFWEIPNGKHIKFVLNQTYRKRLVDYLLNH